MASRKKAGAAKRGRATPLASDRVRPEGEELLGTIGRGVVSPVLHDPKRRIAMGLPEDEGVRGPYMVELNVHYQGGLAEAEKKLRERWERLFGEDGVPPAPVAISQSYLGVKLSVREWRALIANDAKLAHGLKPRPN